MAGKLLTRKESRSPQAWFDEVSPSQYKFPGAAIIRREILENNLSGMDYHGDAFRSLELEGSERILNVGSGDGRDEVRLAVDPEFSHQGKIVALDVPTADDSFMDRFYRSELLLMDAGKANVEFVEGNALALPFPDNSFEVAMWINTGYHFVDIIKALVETQRVLVPGGKFLHLTNARGNKPQQHELITEVKSRAGVPTHRPFSSRFNLEISRLVLPHFFTPLKELEQRDYYGITAETLPNLEYSVDSYRASESEETYKKWVPIRKKVFDEEVAPVIEDGHVWVDYIHRGGGAYENSASYKSLRAALGNRALDHLLAQARSNKRAILTPRTLY